MPNHQKIQIVENLKEKLGQARGLVLTDYQGLSVPEVEGLRRQLTEAKVDYQVVKNSLLKLALKGTGYQLPRLDPAERSEARRAATSYQLTGPTAILINYNDDEMTPLKVLSEFGAQHEAFKIKGGFFEGVWQQAETLLEIAQLPGLEELRARAVGMLQSPIVKLITAAKGNQRKLIFVLKGIVSEKV